ncbi:glycosyltransferase family 39 protein [Alicyclobacillus tolerans]|uniref:4-amino-4-deoxy-L-arabinose transferase-like glycosyltransferase n=1 Tax=Alicyclobacillus tolerans TaxID=90970 RepID=A0ABT9LVE9_9BACL|nr:glycosyltransferase family 39 protein [Alicyclobacillus tengchongensis]MDP9728251.1 4-amino-4-deoxy-L-arabinose transferase-like glycosyltransferase [Alicyclobacillus tengchongensis]
MSSVQSIGSNKWKTVLNTRRIGWFILIVALLFRVGKAYATKSIPIYGDMVHYNHSALFLLLHHVYTYWGSGPAAQITPGYPLFLAAMYAVGRLFSPNVHVWIHMALMGQAVLSAWSVYLLYRLSLRLIPAWGAVLAALLFLTYPTAIWSPLTLLTETLYVFTLLLFVTAFFRALEKPLLRRFFLAGLLLGLCTLVRPTVFPLIIAPVLLFLQSAYRRQMGRSLRNWAIYVIGFILPMFPWWIRNEVVFHKLILTDEDAGNPLLYGTTRRFLNDPALGRGLSPKQQEHLALVRIGQQFAHHPWQSLQWYTVDKLQLLFSTPWYLGQPSHTFTGHLLNFWLHAHLVWVILGSIGLILGLQKLMGRWLTALVFYFVLVQLPFIPINRYVYPVMPFFFIGVAYFLYFAYTRGQRQLLTNQQNRKDPQDEDKTWGLNT